MKIIRDTTDFVWDGPSLVTLGKFDGLHRGHQFLFQKLGELKKETGYPAVLFTFDRSPVSVLNHQPFQGLLTREERAGHLESWGIDCLVEYPFNETTRRMPAQTFIDRVLVGQLHSAHIVTGEDFAFGYQRQGDVEMLKRQSGAGHYRMWAIPKLRDGEIVISSSVIRSCIREGDMVRANQYLGYSYYVEGEIIRGRQLGRTIGIPTINMSPEPDKLLPPFGVYLSETELEGTLYQGITNIGRKPTVSDLPVCGVETHLFDAQGDYYGKTARVSLLRFLRPERKFSSVEELSRQMRADIAEARNSDGFQI